MNYKFSADGFDSPEDWAENEDPDYVELAEAGESKVSCKMFEDEKNGVSVGIGAWFREDSPTHQQITSGIFITPVCTRRLSLNGNIILW